MRDTIPFRGSTEDVEAIRSRLERLGFKISAVAGPDEAAFGDMVVESHAGGVAFRVVRDRGQVWVELGPRDEEHLRYAPSEWLLAANAAAVDPPVDARGEVDLLETHRSVLTRLVADLGSVGGRDGLRAARQALRGAPEAGRRDARAGGI